MQEEKVILTEANIASSCRSFHKPGEYLLLPRSNRVEHALPHFEGVDVQVLASPELGTEFVQHELIIQPNGRTTKPLNKALEHFLFILEGELDFILDGEKHHMVQGGFSWLPPGSTFEFENKSEEIARLTWMQRYYQRVEGVPIPDAIVANEEDVEAKPVDTYMEQHLTPYEDIGFDMGINLQVFDPGVHFSFVETHVIEHGLYMLYGQGLYWLNGDYMEVKKDDFIYLAAYCPQFFYPTGHDKSAYLLYKDVNRDYTFGLTER